MQSAGAPTRIALRRSTIAAIVALAVLVSLGAIARFLGIDFGRPFAYHPDEGVIVGAAMDMVNQRDWNPHTFLYPSFMADVQAAVTALARYFGGPPLDRGQGWLYGNEALPEQFRYFLAGRLVVAAMGVLTILVTFAVGFRMRGVLTGLVAAAVVALTPLHVANSRYVTTDVPVALMCVLTLWVAVEAQRRGGDRWWVLAGAMVGLATSTKWNGAIVAVVPVVAYLAMAPSIRGAVGLLRRRTPYLAIGAGALALIATTPAIIFDATTVRDYLVLQNELYARGRGNERSPGVVFNTRSLIEGLGLVPFIAGAAGCIEIVVGRHRRELMIPAFVGTYFLVASMTATHFERNLVPLVPYLALAGGLVLARLIDRINRRPPLRPPRGRVVAATVAILVALTLVPGYVAAVDGGRRLQSADTRTLALDWIRQHIPRNSIVARERFTPQIPSARYRLRNHAFLWQRNWQWYEEQRVQYLVTSSTIYGQFFGNPDDPVHDRFYRELFALPEVFRADPGPGTPGPTIRIFRLDAP